jgi:NTP pyrophosphatase (non-canonical NTP hydrolase)
MDKLQELLTITMEECGELIQECSKSIRKEHYYNNKELTEEIGDVLCMIELLKSNELVNEHELNRRITLKKLKLKKWSNLL